LDKAALLITHAGVNTVLEALCRAVPSWRCRGRRSAGHGLPDSLHRRGIADLVQDCTPRSCRGLVERVLADDTFRQRARVLQQAMLARAGRSGRPKSRKRPCSPVARRSRFRNTLRNISMAHFAIFVPTMRDIFFPSELLAGNWLVEDIALPWWDRRNRRRLLAVGPSLYELSTDQIHGPSARLLWLLFRAFGGQWMTNLRVGYCRQAEVLLELVPPVLKSWPSTGCLSTRPSWAEGRSPSIWPALCDGVLSRSLE